MATRPDPFASLLARLEKGGRVLVSGKTASDLVRAIMADRVIAGDNLEETMASPNGRTWRATADGGDGGYSHPWKVTVKKDKNNRWLAVVSRNGGCFLNVDGDNRPVSTLDGKGKQELAISPVASTAIMMCWEYTYEGNDSSAPYITAKTYSSASDRDVQPVINGSPVAGGSGQSQVALAYIKPDADDPEKMIVTQLVHTSLRAYWAVGWVDDSEPDVVTPAQLATCSPGAIE